MVRNDFMKKHFSVLMVLFIVLILSACSNPKTSSSELESKKLHVGIMLSDAGLGDQSFSDLGFAGLEKARDELNIEFDYREIKDTKTYEAGLEELVKQDNELIIGLGFSMQEAVEEVASKYPDSTFLLIDSQSDLPNVINVSFKEEEASYLIGAIAGMKTESNVVGFVGGAKVPLIEKFEKGFIEGVKSVNVDAKIITTYAENFGDDKLGATIAKEMISQSADYIYPAAGFTGVGVIQEAQRSEIYSFGVDSDQFYLAEKAVVSSMLKKVDTAIFNAVKDLAETGELSKKDEVLGLKENGVDIAPIRVIDLSSTEMKRLEDLKKEIINGSITILK
jgi:basic membrane protein A